MLSGKFENCYGLKSFELKEIDFTTSNKAIIYAPNGVMKTSFSNVSLAKSSNQVSYNLGVEPQNISGVNCLLGELSQAGKIPLYNLWSNGLK